MSDFRVKILAQYQMIGIEIDTFEDEASELISSDAFVVLTSKVYKDRLIATVYLYRPIGRCYEMEQLKLCESEYRFATIVWENEPLGSGELVTLCEQLLDWKKSTTYTVLKKLCERGVLNNVNAQVTALVKQEQVQRFESKQFINRTFGGSLPQFITAFMNDKKLSKQEAEDLKKLIDSYKEE